jgi:hypothetical protein
VSLHDVLFAVGHRLYEVQPGKIILHKKKVICRLSELSFNRARQRLARWNIAANKGLQFGIDRSNHRARDTG